MTPERWEKIKDLLGNALELRPEERDGYLDRSCDGDPALREEVQNLLAHESTVGSRFLNQTDLADPLR